MKGYLTTCDGAQFELPALLKWEFSYTGSVPCDSFTLKCAYEPAMAESMVSRVCTQVRRTVYGCFCRTAVGYVTTP